MSTTTVVPLERIEQAILFIRGHKVMLDEDLARLYEVNVKALNQAVKRNASRFPADFMFQLTAEEAASLRSQSVTLRRAHGAHRKYLPYAFTEQGVAMLSSVLRSEHAVLVNIEIMRAFVQLRRLLESNVELARKLDRLEKRYDGQFRVVFAAIRKLMQPTAKLRRPVGFRASEPTRCYGS
jgi:hypothetical protein